MHRAIIGMTGSGKTHSAKGTARDVKASGRGVLVLHKPREPWPAECASWQTSDPAEFLRVYWASRSCDCFMELADADVSKWDEGFHKCFSQGRHEGHRNYYLSQRAAMVHPNIRENCSSLCLFAVPIKGARLWAEEFNDPTLLRAVTLPPFFFFFKPSRFSPAQLLKVA